MLALGREAERRGNGAATFQPVGVPVIQGTQIVSAPATSTDDQEDASYTDGKDSAPAAFGGASLQASPCTKCVRCPKMSGWEIAGLVVILVIVLAAFAMGIAALALRASAQHKEAAESHLRAVSAAPTRADVGVSAARAAAAGTA